MRAESKLEAGGSPRINIWRLARNMLLALVIPCTAAIVIDLLAHTWPLITLLVAAFSFPIAGFVVMRSALQELNEVIREVAPEVPQQDDMAESKQAEQGAGPQQRETLKSDNND